MITPLFTLLVCLLSIGISAIAFPIVLSIAKKHAIVDKPNSRKTQKTPVPMLGGVVLIAGILLPLVLITNLFQTPYTIYLGMSLLALLIIGTIDDVRGLSVWIRFVLEIIIIWVVIWQPNIPNPSVHINSLHGLWGRYTISPYTAIPLTIVAGVGILNSINLIDGVDGYSSGFGIIANVLFAIIFFFSHNYIQAVFCLIVVCALIPFYFHNVFGKKSKMFLGDGGSLVIGMIMVWNIFSMLADNSSCTLLTQHGVGLVALALAIVAIPVFDTVRVMSLRLIKGGSPFQPDRTHLHHIFLDMHFSHVATSTCIILSNMLIVGIWYLSYILGASYNVQFYIVMFLAFIATFGFSYAIERCKKHNNKVWEKLCQIGNKTSNQNFRIYDILGHIADFGCK